MKASNILPVLIATVAGVAGQEDTDCGTPPPTSEQRAAIQDAARAPPIIDPAVARASVLGGDPNDWLTVDTYVHMITTSQDIYTFTQSQVDEQIRLMQAHMAPHRIRYNVRNISYTEDDRYIQSASFAHPGAIAMKSELGRGGYDSLNLYFYGGPFGNVGGYCLFGLPNPDTTTIGPVTVREADGCVMSTGCLVGGAITGYNDGGVTTHEIGHWFGLRHVWGDRLDCSTDDGVDDTPIQFGPSRVCPAPGAPLPDTCPAQPGTDNVFNFMDYARAPCMSEFTPGQIRRGENVFFNFRAGVADRFTTPKTLGTNGNAAIIAPQRNCANQATYMGVRRWTDGQFDVERCAQHCRETSQYNLMRGRPACRMFNTYVQQRNGQDEFQSCSLYTQDWSEEFARNTGQIQGSDRITITRSVSAVNMDDNGQPSCGSS